MQELLRIGPMRRPTERQLVSFRRRLLAWFRQRGRHFPWRKPNATTYEQVIAEVLLQRTQANRVATFFDGFIARYPSWLALADTSEAELGSFLQPIGLWKRRAASMRLLGQAVVDMGGRLPVHRSAIDLLPGVGQYIANAIEMFTKREPLPLLDSNMARVLERYFGHRTLVDIRYDPLLQEVARLAVATTDMIPLNWAILDLAAMVCVRRNPHCHQCPVTKGCAYFNALR